MQVLFRRSFDFEGELAIARKHCFVNELRSQCSGDIVVGRYSVLPYYRELEQDLEARGGVLINNHSQHRWIANFEYYEHVEPYTFPTWTDENFHTCNPDNAPFVVKGRTNSRKHQWDTHMFAATRQDAVRIAAELCNDPLLGEQGILYRKYIPLETFEVGINGLPFTNEWRFFFLGEELLTKGYYWSQAEGADKFVLPQRAISFARHMASIVSKHVRFFVLDIAKRADNGEWILVEVNDGQMSGLGMCDPEELYSNLAKQFK